MTINLIKRSELARGLTNAELDDNLTALETNINGLLASTAAIGSAWVAKKIAWFGTSIPAGGGTGSYPALVAATLGATLINEAVGSSCARNGVATARTGPDPYGWAGMSWQNVGYALSGSLVEKDFLINNWVTLRTTLTYSPPATLSTGEQALIRDCSWENKLNRNLGANRADLFVFDHGHNDNIGTDIVTAPPGDSRDRGYFLGAMAFLIDKILADNPRARICFIGHYEDARKTNISLAQKALATQWDFPLCPLWEKLGWSQQTTLILGVPTTMTQVWMPDDLHPSSDLTGAACTLIAGALAAFIRDVR